MDGTPYSSLYVTGTDTGVGKTLASSALLHALRLQGARAFGMKPVASGCERIDGQWRNDDALALQRAGTTPASRAASSGASGKGNANGLMSA